MREIVTINKVFVNIVQIANLQIKSRDKGRRRFVAPPFNLENLTDFQNDSFVDFFGIKQGAIVRISVYFCYRSKST